LVALPDATHLRLHGSLGGSPRARLPALARADRLRPRRVARRRAGRERREAPLPSRGAHRLSARRDRRGARLRGRRARHRPVRLDRRARLCHRPAGDAERAPLRLARGAGNRHLDRLPGAREHGRQHGPAADQGADPAAHELRRLGPAGEFRGAGDPAADRLGKSAARPGIECMSKTILIMAGGTGGHIFPGLAVAEEMRAAGWDVVWMGGRGGMEERLVPPRGYRTALIRARAARGKGLLQKLLLPANLLFSFWESARHIMRVKPDVVLDLGGYVAFPGGMMASLLNRPLALHEQNAIAGLTNRVLAGVCDRVMQGFPDTLKGAEWTGNPVRAAIAALDAPEERFRNRSGPLRILVVGGSLGAQALNETLPRALSLLNEKPHVVHQSGEKHLEALKANYEKAGVRGELVAFIDDMARRYAEADLVICRAGAVTVAELSAGGMASVLVPFPFAVDDHQTANASFLADRGAALLVQQRDLTPEKLAALIGTLDRARLLEMARKARALGKPDAAQVVARRCIDLGMARAA